MVPHAGIILDKRPDLRGTATLKFSVILMRGAAAIREAESLSSPLIRGLLS